MTGPATFAQAGGASAANPATHTGRLVVDAGGFLLLGVVRGMNSTLVSPLGVVRGMKAPLVHQRKLHAGNVLSADTDNAEGSKR